MFILLMISILVFMIAIQVSRRKTEVDIFSKFSNFLQSPNVFFFHPWAGEDLSLKIDEHDQTIWNCILEL